MTRPSLQIKHSIITMLNSVSQEDCSMTVRLVQNLFKQRQSKFGVNVRQFVTSLEEISQHMLQVLQQTGYEECVTVLTSQTQGNEINVSNYVELYGPESIFLYT